VKKSVSSRDVAREAGVSRATVSYILNDVKGISIKPETRERVLEAARKLGYHPDSIARALKTGKSMTIGVVTRRDVSEERFTGILKGIKDILSVHKYSMLICSESINDKGFPDYYSYYREHKIDGVLFISHVESIDTKQVGHTFEIISREKIPAVFIDYHIDNPAVNCVDINYSHGGYLAACHLIEQGHRNIAYLDPGTGSVQEKERIQGVEKAFVQYGVDIRNLKMFYVNEQNILDSIKKVITGERDFSAIIASWINFGFHVLYAANQAKIQVPEQLSVIALAGSNFAEVCFPRLSVSELPLYEVGKKSAEVLVDTIQNNALPVNMKLPCTLKVRDSTCVR